MDIAALWTQIIVFFSDGQFLKLLKSTVVLFFIMFGTWWVYKSLSSKNLFTFLSKHDVFAIDQPTIVDHILHFVRYVFLFPIYSFVAFLLFSLALFILLKPEDLAVQQNLFFTSIVLISTIRIGAYINEGVAEDLAKMVPLSMIGLLVLSESSLQSLGVTFGAIKEFFLLIPNNAKYLVFIVLLEVVLRFFGAFLGKASFEDKE